MDEKIKEGSNSINTQFGSGFQKALETLIESPELKQMEEVSNKAQENLLFAVMQFADILPQYKKLTDQFYENVVPSLLIIEKASTHLANVSRLGDISFVTWEKYPDDFYEKAHSIKTNQDFRAYVYGWLKDHDFKEVDETIDRLFNNEQIVAIPVFKQAIKAYNQNAYDLAALGFTAIIDRLLSEISGKKTLTSIPQRIRIIEDKVIKHEQSLTLSDENDYILISSFTKTIENFAARSDFEGDEPDLNRHWIMHGRTKNGMQQFDCIRLIYFIYGISLLDKLMHK